MNEAELRSVQFRREREGSWRDLAELVEQAERRGMRSLDGEQLLRLPSLYRNAASALAIARAYTLDKALMAYLEALVARAYLVVYGCKRTPWDALRQLIVAEFPRAVRQSAQSVGLAIALMALGMLCGHALVSSNADAFYTIVPSEMASGRTPSSTAAELRKSLVAEAPLDHLQMFASSLFTRNAGVGIMCFSVGFAAGVPTAMLLVYNGMILGAMAAVFARRGLAGEFWPWVLQHGVTELLAICLCGGAGFVLGAALLFPERHSRLESLRRAGRRAGTLMLGAIGMFAIAAVLEGYMRQLVTDTGVRWATVLVSTGVWGAYFARGGR